MEVRPTENIAREARGIRPCVYLNGGDSIWIALHWSLHTAVCTERRQKCKFLTITLMGFSFF